MSAEPHPDNQRHMQRDYRPERAVQFANPVSGEVLTLASRSDDLGRYLADLREFESVIREHKKLVTRELLNRFDKSASWTHRFDGGLKVVGQSPQPAEEWDGAELREALLALVDTGELTIEAVDAAVETVVEYRPRKTGINALRKVGGVVAETVNGLCREVEKERRVTVSRS